MKDPSIASTNAPCLLIPDILPAPRAQLTYDEVMTTEEIIQRIDDRLQAARAELDSLTAARSALESNGGAPRRAARAGHRPTAGTAANRRSRSAASPKPTRRRRRATKSKRAATVVPAGKLEQLLGVSGGLTTAALAKETNADPGQMLPLLRELEAAGRVRRTGQRRGLRWHAVTDEDRIAARAAELASRSRSAGASARK
jgi:hypothetical protein